jgi:hypothetical protein
VEVEVEAQVIDPVIADQPVVLVVLVVVDLSASVLTTKLDFLTLYSKFIIWLLVTQN